MLDTSLRLPSTERSVGEISQTAMFRTARCSKEGGMKSEGLGQAWVGLIINTREAGLGRAGWRGAKRSGGERGDGGNANCIVSF